MLHVGVVMSKDDYFECRNCGGKSVLTQMKFWVHITDSHKDIWNNSEYPAKMKHDEFAQCKKCGYIGKINDFDVYVDGVKKDDYWKENEEKKVGEKTEEKEAEDEEREGLIKTGDCWFASLFGKGYSGKCKLYDKCKWECVFKDGEIIRCTVCGE